MLKQLSKSSAVGTRSVLQKATSHLLSPLLEKHSSQLNWTSAFRVQEAFTAAAGQSQAGGTGDRKELAGWTHRRCSTFSPPYSSAAAGNQSNAASQQPQPPGHGQRSPRVPAARPVPTAGPPTRLARQLHRNSAPTGRHFSTRGS